MTSRIDIIGQNGGDGAHYDDLAHELPEPVIESDLTWLARKLHKWPFRYRDVAVVDNINGEREYRFPVHVSEGGISKQQWLDERARLQNKPRFEDHPDAKCFVQSDDGTWYKNTGTSDVTPDKEELCWRAKDCVIGWSYSPISKGEVLGDWRNTLEVRPEHELNPSTSSNTYAQAIQQAVETGLCADGLPCGSKEHYPDLPYCDFCSNEPENQSEQILGMACDCDGCTDGDDLGPPPSKYHVVINGGWADVYDVLWSFKVTNPATARAVKKLLKPGQRGHKDEITDLTEAAQSIVRAIELIKQ
jgi:hypothetical protein